MSQESDPQTAFEKRAREVLEESTAKLDGRTLSRLTQARHAALEQGRKPARNWLKTWIPAGAPAAAAVLAFMVWTGPAPDATSGLSASSGSALEDIDLLADAPEFVGEADDVEFYAWAADELES